MSPQPLVSPNPFYFLKLDVGSENLDLCSSAGKALGSLHLEEVGPYLWLDVGTVLKTREFLFLGSTHPCSQAGLGTTMPNSKSPFSSGPMEGLLLSYISHPHPCLQAGNRNQHSTLILPAALIQAWLLLWGPARAHPRSVQSGSHSLLLETLRDILHVVPLSLQPGPFAVHYVQLSLQAGDVVLEEGVRVAPGIFLLLEEVPLGL